MKEMIFTALLVVWALCGINANAFPVEKFERMYHEQVIEWEEQHRDEFTEEEIKACQGLTGVGREAIRMRDEGLTLDDALKDLDISLKALEVKYGRKIRPPMEQESARMIQTVFRYPNMEVDEYNQQFMAECQWLEGYR